jgi:3-methyladenine DNA glycosylase AlkD
MKMTAPELIASLQAQVNPVHVAGMARFGIRGEGALGVSMVEIRKLAKGVRDHETALALWASGIHEARILATIVDEPTRVTRRQMDAWARDFDSWDVCDQACMNLFWRRPEAWDMAAKWAGAKREFVRRAGFALIASLAQKAKKEPDERFEAFLPLIVAAATDDRNFVK